jgi:hypothetical protein
MTDALALMYDDVQRGPRVACVANQHQSATGVVIRVDRGVVRGIGQLPLRLVVDEEVLGCAETIQTLSEGPIELAEGLEVVVLRQSTRVSRPFDHHERVPDEVLGAGPQSQPQRRAMMGKGSRHGRAGARAEVRSASQCQQQVRRQADVQHLLGHDARDQPGRGRRLILDGVHREEVWRDRGQFNAGRDSDMIAQVVDGRDRHRHPRATVTALRASQCEKDILRRGQRNDRGGHARTRCRCGRSGRPARRGWPRSAWPE